MNSIVLLKAPGNQGKSETLLNLITLIKEDPSITILIDSTTVNGRDRFLLAKDSTNIIAVLTPGDPGEEYEVEKYLTVCKETGVNFLFCASRTRGGIFNLYWNFAKDNNWRLVTTTPYCLTLGRATTYEMFNTLCAQSLKDLISIISAQQ